MEKALHEFAGQEEAVAGMNAALAQTGQLSEESSEQMQKLAEKMQAGTGVASEGWLNAAKRLVQFGASVEDIQAPLNAVKNLAGIMGGDVESASHMVSRALAGNFHMFSRLGIKIDEHATQAEKLNQLWETLAQRGGGQLEARNATLIGQWKQMTLGFTDPPRAFGNAES